jgi:drug/metabolite transporter (DMT)-like permease
MGLLCITGMTGHYLVIRAYDCSTPPRCSRSAISGLVYASLFGVLLYGETLTWNIVAGSAIVVGAGIFTFWREYVLRLQGPRSKPAQ